MYVFFSPKKWALLTHSTAIVCKKTRNLAKIIENGDHNIVISFAQELDGKSRSRGRKKILKSVFSADNSAFGRACTALCRGLELAIRAKLLLRKAVRPLQFNTLRRVHYLRMYVRSSARAYICSKQQCT
jgi:hypothetical protein